MKKKSGHQQGQTISKDNGKNNLDENKNITNHPNKKASIS